MEQLELNIIYESLISNFFSNYYIELEEKELKHINNYVDYDSIADRIIADNENIHSYINWSRISKMKAIRLVSRNINLVDYINLKNHNYKIKEIFWFIKTDYTRLFKYFNFDLNNPTHEDAYLLLCIGEEYFENLIDIERFKFSFIESMDIIRAYKYKRNIITRLNYKNLKNYQFTEIISMTGEENLDLFNLDDLSTLNWLELLNYQPDFIYKCDFNKFKKGDTFNLINLVILFKEPDLSHLIFEIEDKSEITPFGWEKLLICDPDKYTDICDFRKLNEDNWKRIAASRPELVAYKL